MSLNADTGIGCDTMADTTDHYPAGQHTEPPARSCSLCGDALVESQYPRHQLTLEDEAEETQNQLVNRRLCQTCWQTLYTALTDDTETGPAPSFPRT